MAEILLLSWDRSRLSGIELSTGLTGLRLLNGFSVDWPEQPPTSTWLRETLKRNGINARQVALSLPREDAVLRLLELPAVSDDELPTLVRFQAAARSAQSIDQLLLDFLPLPMRAGIPQKEVWLATVLLSTVDPIRSLLRDAGLDLVQLTISSLCLAELVARAEARRSAEKPGASLVILRQGYRMELAVVHERQLIAAHTVKWSSANEIPPVAKMLAEVSRVLVQVQGWLPEGTLQHGWVIGEDADVGDLPEALSRRWKCPVERLNAWRDCQLSPDTSKFAGSATDYAIAAGLALIQSGGLTPRLDLLHPRQPAPKRDPRKPLYAAGAAAGLLVAAIGTAIVQQTLASYDSLIANLHSEELKLDRQLKEGEPTFVAANTIEDWQSRNINQLNQMAELYREMDGTKRIVISDYQFNTSAGNVIGKLKLVGRARARQDFQQLEQHLDDLPNFKVPPTAVTAISGDPDYISRFDLEMELVAVKKKTAATGTPAPASNAKTPAPAGTK